MTSFSLLPLLGSAVLRAGSLALPTVPLPEATTCLAVDAHFQADPSLASLLVQDPAEPGQVGLVSRVRFLQLMAGPFGFGRALFGTAPVERVAQWDPVVIDADASVQQAASAVLHRPADARYDDLVVRFEAGVWGTLSAAAVLEALSRGLAEQVVYDGLTSLVNREVLLSELSRHCASPEGGLALLFLDLDRFKQVNDAHGHHAGDVLLQAVADRLRAAARPGDLVARLGGDEFAIVLTGLPDGAGEPVRSALSVARRLLAAVTQPVAVGGSNVFVGASIGVAISAPEGSDPDTLLREADLAMYEAKRGGGDRIHTVTSIGFPADSPLLSLAIDDTLAHALESGQFRLHYQPIQDLRSGRTVSVEALIRWQHPQHGLLPPGRFLPAAEDSGFIVALDRWVVEEACRQLVRWDLDPAVEAPESVNVNLSRQHLGDPGLLRHVTTALDRSGLAPARLRLELPETATLADLDAAAPALAVLRASGVKLTLDDLGAGSSTLRHLSDLPLDGVKIDRSFVASLLDNERDAAVVRLLVGLAHDIALDVTAEGIETAGQRQALLELGCTYGQGYHLGRPEPAGAGAPSWSTPPGSSTRSSSTPGTQVVGSR